MSDGSVMAMANGGCRRVDVAVCVCVCVVRVMRRLSRADGAKCRDAREALRRSGG